MTRKSSKALNKSSSHPSSKPRTTHNNKIESLSHRGLVIPKTVLTYTLPPADWPASIPYLASNILSPELGTPSTASHILQSGPDLPPSSNGSIPSIPSLSTYTASSNPLIKILTITDTKHPAHSQTGLFAARHIPPGSHIVDYTGLVHICPRPSCAESDYDLAFLERDAALAIDSASMGNEGRFVNDYHGICHAPNAVFEEYWIKTKAKGRDVWQARMGVWCSPASKGIAKDEEICVGYGKGWWRARRGVMEDVPEKDDGGSDQG